MSFIKSFTRELVYQRAPGSAPDDWKIPGDLLNSLDVEINTYSRENGLRIENVDPSFDMIQTSPEKRIFKIIYVVRFISQEEWILELKVLKTMEDLPDD